MELLSLNSNAFLYGRAVFTTLVFADREPLFWDKHYARLASDAERIGLKPPDPDHLYFNLRRRIGSAGLSSGRARVSLFDPSESVLWGDGLPKDAEVSIVTGAHRALPARFRLVISTFPVNSRSPLAGVKSANYLESQMALEAARGAGFDEAVRLNERGEIVSTACANLFWTSGGRIFTPGLETGCLPGTTRALIVENFEVVETNAGLDTVRAADAMIITSCGIGAGLAALKGATVKSDGIATDIIRFVRTAYHRR
jgi:branched-subunit amino acid aminotransferase/4-amino-4-deoxychorismate lyase